MTQEKGLGQDNPYTVARAEYGDRYGSAVKDVARWRQISILLVFLCFAFGGTMMWMAAQNKVIPYIVQIDKQGYAVTIKSSEQGSVADTRVIIATLGRFFMNFKTIVADTPAQRQMVDNVYAYLARNSSAEAVVSNHYREHNPYAAAQDKRQPTMQVEVRSVVRSGKDDKSWQILWTEEKLEHGFVVSKTEWRAIVSIAVSPVRELEEVLKNPLEIYITEINMAQDITPGKGEEN